MKITILDPAMCCSTGVCGTEINDDLVMTAANVKWLKSLGHDVHRHSLSNDAVAFKDYPEAIEKLQKEGADSLPYIFVNDKMVMSGQYPEKANWEKWIQTEEKKFSMVELATASVETKSSGSCCSGSSCC